MRFFVELDYLLKMKDGVVLLVEFEVYFADEVVTFDIVRFEFEDFFEVVQAGEKIADLVVESGSFKPTDQLGLNIPRFLLQPQPFIQTPDRLPHIPQPLQSITQTKISDPLIRHYFNHLLKILNRLIPFSLKNIDLPSRQVRLTVLLVLLNALCQCSDR